MTTGRGVSIAALVAGGDAPSVPGPEGPPGPAGPAGPAGPTGPAGGPGPTGPAGGQGPAGPQGLKGDTGNQGPQGLTGGQGPAGNTGLQGPPGNNGAQGPPGADGAAGAQGSQGIQGIQGPAGPQGTAGIPPTGALGQTYPRGADAGNIAVLSSGRLQLVGIMLPTGTTVTNVVFMSGTTVAGSPTNQWFGLFDLNRVALRLTANALTAAWAANTSKLLALTAPFVTTYTGLHYLGVMVTATTVPTLTGAAVTAGVNTIPPIVHGNSNTGQTVPPGLPFTAAALTGAANTPWGYVT